PRMVRGTVIVRLPARGRRKRRPYIVRFAGLNEGVAQQRPLLAARAAEVLLVPRVLVGAGGADLGDEVAAGGFTRGAEPLDLLDQAPGDGVEQGDAVEGMQSGRGGQGERGRSGAGVGLMSLPVSPSPTLPLRTARENELIENRGLPVVRAPEAELVAPHQARGLHGLVELAGLAV